jgi:hypothetical protein
MFRCVFKAGSHALRKESPTDQFRNVPLQVPYPPAKSLDRSPDLVPAQWGSHLALPERRAARPARTRRHATHNRCAQKLHRPHFDRPACRHRLLAGASSGTSQPRLTRSGAGRRIPRNAGHVDLRLRRSLCGAHHRTPLFRRRDCAASQRLPLRRNPPVTGRGLHLGRIQRRFR